MEDLRCSLERMHASSKSGCSFIGSAMRELTTNGTSDSIISRERERERMRERERKIKRISRETQRACKTRDLPFLSSSLSPLVTGACTKLRQMRTTCSRLLVALLLRSLSPLQSCSTRPTFENLNHGFPRLRAPTRTTSTHWARLRVWVNPKTGFRPFPPCFVDRRGRTGIETSPRTFSLSLSLSRRER